MKKFCIVIPVYKEQLDCVEQMSLKRLWNVINEKNYDVYLVCPELMNVQEYKKIYPTLKTIEFDASYFKSTATYSQLCISDFFYETFIPYEYMYIYQLDCYLVYDQLEAFCNLGYDYIGAPILSTDCGWSTIINGKYCPKVGNGGFSLRKISTFIDLTSPNGEFRTYYKITDEMLQKIKYEDFYFCEIVYNKYNYNIAPFSIGMNFAWDMSADIIYNLWNIKILPMAIHAVDKNIRLWKKLLPEIKDNNEIIDYCEEKHKEFFKLYYDKNDSSAR